MAARIAAARKDVLGTARPGRRIARATGERLDRAPPAPASLTDAGKAEWRALAAGLVNSGTLTTNDLRTLQLLAETLAHASDLAATIEREGVTVAAGSGGRKGHPALSALATARGLARQLLADFGLSPRAREGVEAAPPAVDPEKPLVGLASFRKPPR